MIANARMYSVIPESAGLWRTLLSAIIEHAGLDIRLLEQSNFDASTRYWRDHPLAVSVHPKFR
jgi:hypothetical protein